MMRCCPPPWHSPDPILSPHHLRCQYTPCLHNCNSLIWNFCLDNIRACVSRAQGLHCHWQLALRGEVWISIECQWSVTGSYQPHNPDHNTQYKSNTCRILSNKSNSHELCFFFNTFLNMESCCAGPTLTPPRIWQMLKTTQSISPSSHLMIRMTNIILYLRLVVGCYASIIESSCKINCIPNHNIMFHDGMWPRSHSNDWKGWQTRCYFPWLGTERERCKSYGRGETCKETS